MFPAADKVTKSRSELLFASVRFVSCFEDSLSLSFYFFFTSRLRADSAHLRLRLSPSPSLLELLALLSCSPMIPATPESAAASFFLLFLHA